MGVSSEEQVTLKMPFLLIYFGPFIFTVAACAVNIMTEKQYKYFLFKTVVLRYFLVRQVMFSEGNQTPNIRKRKTAALKGISKEINLPVQKKIYENMNRSVPMLMADLSSERTDCFRNYDRKNVIRILKIIIV